MIRKELPLGQLALSGVKKRFEQFEVIHGIDLEIHNGEFVVFVGPSGCGKSTLLRMICGLEEISEGDCHINGTRVNDLPPVKRGIAMVFQSYALYPHMNVRENMSFSLKMKKQPRHEIEEKVRRAAELLDIADLMDRKPKELSGGQRQRVAIGRAIVRNPKLFLFDEPLSNLDAKLRSSMRVELAKLHQKLKATTVYVTHDQIEAMTLGEKIVLLDQGVIQQTGTPDEMYHNPANLFVATFIGTPQINLIKGYIVRKDSNVIFDASGFSINLGAREELRQNSNREITMGIRPEALTPGDGNIKGTLELTEHLGPETLIYVRVDNTRLIAKAPPDFRGEQGSGISLALEERGIHFFYEGQRI